MSLTEHIADSPSGPLRWLETSGRGGAVALLHGNSSSVEHWRPLLESPLGARYRVCALELPGHGHSVERESSCYTLDGLRASVRTWLAAAGLQGAACVGHSLGGHLWLQLGASALDAQAGLFVFGAPPLRSAASAAEAFVPTPVLAAMGKRELCADEARQCADLSLGPTAVGREAVASAMRHTDGRFREHFMSSLATQLIDEVAVLDAMHRPVALVHGECDPLVSRAYLDALAPPTLWRGAVQTLARAGHYPHLTEPASLEALLGEFLAEVLVE